MWTAPTEVLSHLGTFSTRSSSLFLFCKQADPRRPRVSWDLPLLLTWLSTRLSNCGGRKECVGPCLSACLLLTDPHHLYTALRGLVNLGNNLIWLMASHVYYFAKPARQSRKEITCITSKPQSVWREEKEDNGNKLGCKSTKVLITEESWWLQIRRKGGEHF